MLKNERQGNHRLIDVSVIVCTYNRARSLTRTLQCLKEQQLPASVKWEVVVVDNNSNDDTQAVVKEVQRSFASLRCEFEPSQGLSYARNRGIAVANGKILLFTDDDVCPERDWVNRIIEGMEYYACDACGGTIEPVWEAPPPAWLTERFYGFLALRVTERQPTHITNAADAPFGANMAFKREIFDQVDKFDTSRGRKANVLASGEELDLFERLLTKGYKVMFLPQARVHHHIEAFRVKKRYFRRWRFQTSRNIAQSRGLPGTRQVLGVPLYLIPQTLRAIWNAVIGYSTLPHDEAFRKEMIVWHFLGLISGLLRHQKTTRSHDGS